VKGIAAIVPGDGKTRVELDRLVVVDNRAVVVALEAVDTAAIAERAGVSRIELDRLVQVGEGRIEVALLGEVVAANAQRAGKLASLDSSVLDHVRTGRQPRRGRAVGRDAGLQLLSACAAAGRTPGRMKRAPSVIAAKRIA